jgi:MFS family permease
MSRSIIIATALSAIIVLACAVCLFFPWYYVAYSTTLLGVNSTMTVDFKLLREDRNRMTSLSFGSDSPLLMSSSTSWLSPNSKLDDSAERQLYVTLFSMLVSLTAIATTLLVVQCIRWYRSRSNGAIANAPPAMPKLRIVAALLTIGVFVLSLTAALMLLRQPTAFKHDCQRFSIDIPPSCELDLRFFATASQQSINNGDQPTAYPFSVYASPHIGFYVSLSIAVVSLLMMGTFFFGRTTGHRYQRIKLVTNEVDEK